MRTRPFQFPWPRKGKVFIGRGNQLIRFDAASSRSTVIELPFPVRRLTPNPPFTVSRMIAAFDSGCAVVQESGEYQFIALDLADVVTCFTPEGSIVAIGGGKGHIYRRSGAKLAFLSAFDVSRVPIAVLPAGNSEVAVFDSQGAVDVYRLGAVERVLITSDLRNCVRNRCWRRCRRSLRRYCSCTRSSSTSPNRFAHGRNREWPTWGPQG